MNNSYFSLYPCQPFSRLALGVKLSADDILKYFFYFPQKTGFDISSKLSPMETICLKCLILFSGKNKKMITNLSCAESAQGVIKFKDVLFFFFKFCLKFSATMTSQNGALWVNICQKVKKITQAFKRHVYKINWHIF